MRWSCSPASSATRSAYFFEWRGYWPVLVPSRSEENRYCVSQASPQPWPPSSPSVPGQENSMRYGVAVIGLYIRTMNNWKIRQ